MAEATDGIKMFVPEIADFHQDPPTPTKVERQQFPPKMDEPQITVGIMSGNEIRFTLNGTYRCTENNQIYTGDFVAKHSENQIVINDKPFPELHFEPLDYTEATFELADVTIGIHFHWERKESQRFRGALHLIVDNEKVIAINRIKTEDYLFCVIASEMSATASLELLKAHAVISRSWLLKPILEKTTHQQACVEQHTDGTICKYYERDAHTHFDVCADDHCQRYQGVTRAKTDLVRQAIEATRGEVLTTNNGICDARFSKSCGGVSELFENCWANEHHTYLTPVRDATAADLPDLTIEANAEQWIRSTPESFCNTSDKRILSQVLNTYDQETTDFYRWKVHYSIAELSELIRQKSGIDFGEIVDLQPVSRGASGRLTQLRIVGTKRTIVVGKELEIRKWLSPSHLYSSAFVVDKTADGFTLIGAGWGHGVGLCQIGAAVMGEQGYNYQQILSHYFRGATLCKLY